MTGAQKTQLGNARTAASKAIRDAAAKGKRISGTEATEAATGGVKPAAAAAQFKKGETYTNAAGKQAKFGGVDAQGKNIWLAP